MTLSKKPLAFWAYHLATVAIGAGLLLTLISWLKLCSSMCNEAHNYRLFGLPFEVGGAVYFITLAVLHYFYPLYRFWTRLLIAAGLGAEIFFVLLQKYQIGSWCPVCLTIATSISILGICYWILGIKEQHEDYMRTWIHKGLLFGMLTLGFTTSFFGVTKFDQLQAIEDTIKEKIKFGNLSSPIEVYIFTDWACPACRGVEPTIEALAPKIMKEAQLTFIDTVVHPETLNYAPYNISFMANAKPQYLQIRKALGKLSIKTKKPTDEEISSTVEPIGVTYNELPYEDVSLAMRYFEDLVGKFKVTGTPTVAVVNRQAKKGKKFSGQGEITESNIMKAIESLR